MLRIAIVGAGIGGLTTAIALRKSIWIADQGLRTTPLWPVPALSP
jgi:2-polyprenyl-6-methoxyphenol hydroxylase-like FAD-dependent oxidoreductase